MFTGQDCASLIMIADSVAGLAEREGCTFNQAGFTHSTPLVFAAYNGQDREAKILLRQDKGRSGENSTRARGPQPNKQEDQS